MKKLYLYFFSVATALLLMFFVLNFFTPKNDNYKDVYYVKLSPVLKIEFTHDPEIIRQMFSYSQDNDKFKLKDEINFANFLDFIYMLLYSSFMFLFAKIITKNKKRVIVLLIPFIAFFLDYMENLMTFKVLSNLDNDFSGYLWIEWGFSITKWLIISLFFVLVYSFEKSILGKINFIISFFILFIGIYAILFNTKVLFFYILLVSLNFFLALLFVISLKFRYNDF